MIGSRTSRQTASTISFSHAIIELIRTPSLSERHNKVGGSTCFFSSRQFKWYAAFGCALLTCFLLTRPMLVDQAEDAANYAIKCFHSMLSVVPPSKYICELIRQARAETNRVSVLHRRGQCESHPCLLWNVAASSSRVVATRRAGEGCGKGGQIMCCAEPINAGNK